MKQAELWRKNLWHAMRRAPRDREFLTLLGWAVGPASYLICIGLTALRIRIWVATLDGTLLALAYLVVLTIVKTHTRASQSLLKLSARSQPEATQSALAEHRGHLVDELLRTAARVDRAGCEAMIRSGQWTTELVGTSRQRTLELVRERGLWDGYSVVEQELLLSPEGSWSEDTITETLQQIEDVRVMRWVLGMDRILTPFEFLEPNLRAAVEIIGSPDKTTGTICLEPSDIRPAQTGAQRMFVRCVEEGAGRGLYPTDEEDVQAILRMGGRTEALMDGELFIGTETVGEADSGRLCWMTEVSLRRLQVMTRVIGYLSGEAETFLANKIDIAA